MSFERREYRIAFTHVERNLHIERAVVLSRNEHEPLAHLTLRVLSWLLLWEEGLIFCPGTTHGEAADLIAEDLTGRVKTWIACGEVDPWLLRKVVQHNRDAVAHVVFGSTTTRERFVTEVESWGGRRPRGWERITLWTIDAALVDHLAAHEAVRQRWTSTFVGDQFYVDVNGEAAEGAVVRG
ncbi:MAG TPA: YaeQ family protein [Polyangia bacterium]